MSTETEVTVSRTMALTAMRRMVADHSDLDDRLTDAQWIAYTQRPVDEDQKIAFIRCLLGTLLSSRIPMSEREAIDCSRIMLALAPNGDHAA